VRAVRLLPVGWPALSTDPQRRRPECRPIGRFSRPQSWPCGRSCSEHPARRRGRSLTKQLTRLRLRPTSHATLQPNKSPARRLRCTQTPATCGTMNPRTPRHSASRNPGAGPTRQPPPLATQRRSRHPAFGGRAHSHSRTPRGSSALFEKLDSFTTTFQLQDF